MIPCGLDHLFSKDVSYMIAEKGRTEWHGDGRVRGKNADYRLTTDKLIMSQRMVIMSEGVKSGSKNSVCGMDNTEYTKSFRKRGPKFK
jgi:hypothetical protein